MRRAIRCHLLFLSGAKMATIVSMTSVRFRRVCASAAAAAFLLPVSVMGASSSSAPSATVRVGGVQISAEQNVPVMGDFTFGPSRFTLSMAPGEERTVDVQVMSRAGRDYTYVFEAEDFAAGADAKGATTLFGPLAGPYPARTWVKAAVPSVVLAHGQRAFVPVTIRVPKDAEPGDHYAALLLKRTLRREEMTDKGFDIVSRVGILFLVSVEGDVVKDAAIESLTTRSGWYWSLPAWFDLAVENKGTVYAAPMGTIRISNILGFTVDELPVKDLVVLRESRRSFPFQWQPTFALGRYTAETNVMLFDQKTTPVSVSFWVVPAFPVLIGLLLIFTVSFFVQFFFSRFEVRKKA